MNATRPTAEHRGFDRSVDRCRSRLRLVRATSVLQTVSFAGLAAAALFVLIDKLVHIPLPYALAGAVLGCLCLAALAVAYLLAGVSPGTACYLVDRSAGLKNLAASARAALGTDDEVSRLVVGRAAEVLTRQNPGRLFPFRLTWTGRYLYAPALACAAVLLLPSLDLLGRKQKDEQRRAEALAVQTGAQKLASKLAHIEERPDSLRGAGESTMTQAFAQLAAELKSMSKADALTRVGEFETRHARDFAGQKQFENAAKALTGSPDLQGIPPSLQRPLQDLFRNFKDGNLGQAAQAARDLAKQLENRELTPQERRALARELAKAVEALSRNGAGKNTEELAKLLRDIEGSREGIDALAVQAADAMKNLAQNMDEMDALKAMKEGLADAKKDMLGEEFADFDSKEVEAYMDAEAAMASLGESMNAGAGQGQGAGDGDGDGTGGQGHGRGGNPPEESTDTAFKDQKSQSKTLKGKILNQMFVSGTPEKGEASSDYGAVVEAARRDAASSLARETIPKEYEEIVKTYFDSIDTKAPPAQPPAPP